MQLIVPTKLGWIALLAVSFLLISDNNENNNDLFRAEDPVGCDETVNSPDYIALKNFYEASNGDSWTNSIANNRKWLSCNVCSWYGIVCEDLRVVEINLPNNNVSGGVDITADGLSNIRRIDLSGNELLSNGITSSTNNTSLEYLDLSANHLTSIDDIDFGSLIKMKHLNFANNQITSIPTSINYIWTLEHLNFSNNSFSGIVPFDPLGIPAIKHLDLSGNDFSGNFPSYMGNYNFLQYLDLSDNQFYGCIPGSYSVHCDIQNNVFLDENCNFDDPTFIEYCNGVTCDQQLILTGPDSTCVGENYIIYAESGYFDYQWSAGCDGPQNRAPSNSVSKTCPGTYYVTITNNKGCSRVGSITIHERIEDDRSTSVSFCEGGSVTVAGRTFDSSGIYQVSQVTASGCSYILHVTVTEELRPRNTYNLEICNGSSQSIHGTPYNSAGTFTQNQYNPSGCDSLLTVNVIILETFADEVSYSVCPGSTATHDGGNYGEGTFYRTYAAQNGCDSIVTIEVSELPTFTTNITLNACEGETVEHDGIDYTESDTRIYTAQNGCDSILYITVNPLAGSNTAETHDICNGQSVEIFDSTYTAGIYNIPYFNEDGCLSNLELTVNETAPYILRDTVQMCNGVQVNYDGIHYYSTPGSFTIDTVDNEGCNYIIALEIPGGTTSIEDITVQRCDNEVIYVNDERVYGNFDTQILTNASGCDSILNIHVNSGSSNSETMYIEYCPTDPPIINDITYNQSGWVTQPLTNVSGCDSTLHIYLTKFQKTSGLLVVQVCPGQDATVNGVIYENTGWEEQILENAFGCDSILRIFIEEKDTIKTEFHHTLCGNETITVGDITYSESTNDIQTYETSSGCDSLVYIYIEKFEHTTHTVYNRLCTGDTLTYNEDKIYASGTYTQNLENNNGCDSTLTIIIEEFSPSDSYNYRETCEGTPWNENGQNFYSEGIYMQTMPNAVGCDSIITIDLTVHQHTSETLDLQVCKDQTRYINDIAYSSEGSFEQNLTNNSGCDSTLTIVVEIVDEVRANYHEDLCEGQSTTINGEFFNTTRTIEQNFISSIGCDSILTVSVIVHPHTFGEVETTVCTGEEQIVNGFVYKNGGVYSQVIENAAGCDSTITVTIEELSPTSSYASYEMCEGDPISINSFNYEFGGEFSQTFINSVGCDSTLYISIKEHPDTDESIYRYICPGEIVAVNNIDYSVPSVYEQSFTNAKGCDSTLYINVEYSAPKDTILFDFICDEGVYDFKGSTYYTQGMYRYDTLTQRGCDSTIFLDLGLLTGRDTTIYRTICKNEPYYFGSKKLYQGGSYYDEIIIGGCKTPTTLELTVLEPVEGYREVHKCEGELFWVNGKYESKAGLYTEVIESAQGCDSVLISELIYESAKETVIDTFLCYGESVYFDYFLYKQPGNYKIPRTTKYGCDSIVKLNIEWYDNEVNVITMDVCEGGSVEFEGEEYGVGTYSGIYFDGSCNQEYELIVQETMLKKMNKTIMLCAGEEEEYLGRTFNHLGQFYLGELIGTCEYVEYVNVIQESEEGALNEVFLCEGTSMEIGELLIKDAGTYVIENCGVTDTYSVNFINGDTTLMERKINPGQSILIEGDYYGESGEYFIEVGREAGCATIIKLVILLEACGGERTINKNLCAGDVFDFYGKEISDKGHYEFVKNLGFECDSLINLEIEFIEIPGVEIVGQSIICEDSEVLLSGPEGYTYEWSTGEKSQQIYVDEAGEYELTIFNTAGCSSRAIFETEVISFPSSLDIYKSEPSECGVEDGDILVDVPEPENYVYSKDGGLNWQESPFFENLGAESYSILLADPSLTCTRKNTFEITLKNDGIPEIKELLITQSNDCKGQKGSILVFMESWDVPMEYSIDGGLNWREENYFTELDDGFYELLISPVGSSCVNNYTENIEIRNTANLESEVVLVSPLTCIGSGDAIAQINILSGHGPYKYSWSNGSSDSIVSGLNSGIYNVTVRDISACVQILNFEIEDLDLSEITVDFQDSTLCDNDTLNYGELDSLFHYQLFKEGEFLSEGNSFQIAETGHYQVYAENESGCSTATDFLVEKASPTDIGADFLLSSNGLVGEDIYIINISDPMPEKYSWGFDTSLVEYEIIDSLTQRVYFKDTGEYAINYLVDNDGCLLNIEKKIKIYPDSTTLEQESNSVVSGLEKWSVNPNPNDGNFDVEIDLNEESDVRLLLFNMYGAKVGLKFLRGENHYIQSFRLPSLQTGIYSIVLINGNNVYQKNILVIN